MKHIHSFIDRHGTRRVYYRPPGGKVVTLPPDIGSKAFIKAYEAAVAAFDATAAPRKRRDVKSKRPQIENLHPKMPKIGVYLLFDAAGELSYVGSSQNIPERVSSHRQNGREFADVFWIPTKQEDRLRVEAALIKAFAPRQNRKGNPESSRAALQNRPRVSRNPTRNATITAT